MSMRITDIEEHSLARLLGNEAVEVANGLSGPRHNLPALYPISQLAIAFEQPARNTKCQGRFVLRFNPAGK